MYHFSAKILFWGYNLLLLLFALMPLSSVGVSGLNKTEVMGFRSDHLLHMLVFVPWYTLAVFSFYSGRLWQYILLFVAGLIFGFFAEFVQYFISYRSYNFHDLWANLIGVTAGVALYFVALPFLKKYRLLPIAQKE